jgi:Flp pilus assembly protein TadG
VLEPTVFASSLTRRFARLAARFRRASGGGIAMTFAMSLPVLLAIVGAASDYAVLTKIRAELQEAADAAAMAGAREIPLANADPTQVENTTRTFAIYRLTGNSSKTEADLAGENITLKVEVAKDFSDVKVDIQEKWSPFFAHLVMKGVTPVRVSSSARFVGHANICVLATATSGQAVFLDKNARLTANKCGVFSNSADKDGLRIETGVTLSASIICSAGGIKYGGSPSVTPTPLSDCPPVEDPLASRPMPSGGACDHKNFSLSSANTTIDPGVYCGGISISGSSNVKLNPGTYILRNGGLSLTGDSYLTGEGVGFFITGAKPQRINFGPNSHVSLKAPTTGVMAGLLIFENRNLGVKLNHRITSDDARVLLGTIYLPVGSLIVDAKEPVADQSAYTAIVAKSVELNSGPNLVLNSDYEATDVPVPAGIAGSSQVILSN